MALYDLVFSPTGGTQKVTDIIVDEFTNETIKIDLTDKDINFEEIAINSNDIVIIAVPSYAGRVPKLSAERISKIKGNNAKTILVCVYGNREFEDTLTELYDIAVKCGFKVIAAISAVAQHSIIKKIASHRPDAKDVNELRTFTEKIIHKIESGNIDVPVIPGNRPYKQVSSSKMIPFTTDDCISCGECARRCPSGAINENNPKETNSEKCIACMRCVDICEKSARKVDSALLENLSSRLEKICEKRKDTILYL